MKTIKFLFTLLLIAFLSACSDEPVDPALLNQSNNNNNNNNGNNGNTAGVLTAKIDGVDFSSTSNSGTYTAVGTNTQLLLSGNTSDGKTITISITNPAVGTVNASLSSCVLAYASQGTFFTSTNPATSTSVGTVTLTSFDTVNNRVTGTFSFTGYNNDGTITRQIANGSINSFPFTNSVTSSGGGGGTSTGDYWPTALNNEWNYNGDLTSTQKIVSVDVIGGNTYYTFNPQSGSGGSSTASNVVSRLRKNAGDYFIKQEDSNITGGGLTGVMTGFEMTILKDYLAVNATWNGLYTQDITYAGMPSFQMITSYTGTILEKGSTVNVNGTTYNNIIKIKIIQSASFSGSITTTTNYYWFAKDIGPVKIETNDGTTSYVQNLTTYTLN